MSFVSERESNLILDFVLNRITKEVFYREFPMIPDTETSVSLAMLQRASVEQDPDGVELGLYLGYKFGFSQDFLDVLCTLAVANWHYRHEDVISALAQLRLPKSVDAIYEAARMKHPYLEFDDAYALGVKCIWALAEIGDRTAVVRLGELMYCGNHVIESNAKLQLVRVEKEAVSQDVRVLAKEILAT